MPWRVGVLSLLAMAAFSCAPSGSLEYNLASEDPAQKIPAIKQAVERSDRSVLPQLVKDLDNDDSAVRFYAIWALQKLTGQTFDYAYYQDEAARRPAIDRWKRWLTDTPAKSPKTHPSP